MYNHFGGGYDNFYTLPIEHDSMKYSIGNATTLWQNIDIKSSYEIGIDCVATSATVINSGISFMSNQYGADYAYGVFGSTVGTKRALLRSYANSSGGAIELDIDGSGYHNLLEMSSLPHRFEDITGASALTEGNITYQARVRYAVFIPDYISTVYGTFYSKISTSTVDGYIKFSIGGTDSTAARIDPNSYAWTTEVACDVSAKTGGWYELIISMNAAYGGQTLYLNGWSFRAA